MQLAEAAQLVRRGRAILFAGAGFSLGATNAQKNLVPTSGQLCQKLLDELKLADPMDLPKAANLYARKRDRIALRAVLISEFTVSDTTSTQNTICNQSWRRIYTTNYDDAIEACLFECKRRHQTFLAGSPRAIVDAGALDVVHLHGSVRAIANQGADEIVLTSADYAADLLSASAWLPVLRNDLDTAAAIVFVGYSLSDLDISRILSRADELKHKVVFICATDEPEHNRVWLSDFGTVHACGATVFSDALDSAIVAHEEPEDEFLSLAPLAAEDPAAQIGPDQAIQLFAQGIIEPSLFSLERAVGTPYSVKRFGEAQVRNALKSGNRRFLVHSDFGNGKTIFLSQLGLLLAKDGYRVFKLARRTSTTLSELERIRQSPEPACILVDNVQRFSRELRSFCIALPANKVVIATTRTHQYEVDWDELDSVLGNNALVIDLNDLRGDEIGQIDKIFETYGLWGPAISSSATDRRKIIKERCDGELRSFLLWTFQNGSIADKVRHWTENVSSTSTEMSDLVCAVLMIGLSGIEFRLDEICDLMRLHPDRTREAMLRSEATELLSVRGWHVEVRSPIISEHVLQRVVVPETCERVLVRLIRSLSEHAKYSDDHNDLLRELMRLRFVGLLFRGEDRDAHILSFYNEISGIAICKENPQFWLQYAMARMQREQFQLAEKYFQSAYSLAATRKGYNTFQIDNQFVQFLFRSRARQPYQDVDAIAGKACQMVSKQLSASKSQWDFYPLKVIDPLVEFWESRNNTIREETRTLLLATAGKLRDKLDDYSGGQLRSSEIDRMRISLDVVRKN